MEVALKAMDALKNIRVRSLNLQRLNRAERCAIAAGNAIERAPFPDRVLRLHEGL